MDAEGIILRVREFKNNWNDWRWYYFQFTLHIVPIYFSFKKNNGIYIVEDVSMNIDKLKSFGIKPKGNEESINGILDKFNS